MEWLTFVAGLLLGLLWGATIGRGCAGSSPEVLLRRLLVDAVEETKAGGKYFLTICLSKRDDDGNVFEKPPDLSMLQQHWKDQ